MTSPSPGMTEVAYIAKPFRARYGVRRCSWRRLLVLTAGEAANSWPARLPPNRGDLTVAEFAENYNRQVEYLGFGGRSVSGRRRASGRNQPEVDENGSYAGLTLDELMGMEDWPEARDVPLHSGGRPCHGGDPLRDSGQRRDRNGDSPDGYVPLIVMALALGREEACLLVLVPAGPAAWSWSEADWDRGLHPPSAGSGHHCGGGADRLLLLCGHRLAAYGGGEPPLLHLHRGPGQRMTGIKNGASRNLSAARRQSCANRAL